MELNEYQTAGQETNLLSGRDQSERLIAAMLGLASEAGSLLDVQKKIITEQIDQETGDEVFRRELGDLLWYVAAVAKAKGYELEEVARSNLDRTRSLWEEVRTPPDFILLRRFDDPYPIEERFPRRLVIDFTQFEEGQHLRANMQLVSADPTPFSDGPIVDYRGLTGKIQGYELGAQIGDYLTDNSRRIDGYRFHDAVHLGFLAVLGWSPTIRSVLRLKRRSDEVADDAEDGARAIFSEEALAAALSRLARRRMDFRGGFNVDGETLDVAAACTEGLEVEGTPGWAWRQAIVSGFQAKRDLTENNGGRLTVDLDNHRLEFTTLAEPQT